MTEQTVALTWEDPDFKPFHSYIPDAEKLPYILDLETLSMEPNAAIVEICLKPVFLNEPACRDFRVYVAPSWYANSAPGTFHIDPATVAWHEEIHPNYLIGLEDTGWTGETVAGMVRDFMVRVQKEAGKQLVLMTQGTDFDIPILGNLLKVMGLKLPWHHRNVRDLRTLQALTPHLEYSRGDHTALGDVNASREHLRKQIAISPLFRSWLLGSQESKDE